MRKPLASNTGCIDMIRGVLLGCSMTKHQICARLPQFTPSQIHNALSQSVYIGSGICSSGSKGRKPATFWLQKNEYSDKPKRYHRGIAPPLSPRAYNLMEHYERNRR